MNPVKWSTSIPELGRPVVLAGCAVTNSGQKTAVQSVGNVFEGTSSSTKRTGGGGRKWISDQDAITERSAPHLHVVHGAVSRLEVVEYSHSGASLLSYQVDAALRHNRFWGGGLFDVDFTQEGSRRCVGILFQRSSSEAWSSRYGTGAVGGSRQGRVQTTGGTSCCSTPVSSETWASQYGTHDVQGSRQRRGQATISMTSSSAPVSSDTWESRYGAKGVGGGRQQSSQVLTSMTHAGGHRGACSATDRGDKRGLVAPKSTGVRGRSKLLAPAACTKTVGTCSSNSSSSSGVGNRQYTQRTACGFGPVLRSMGEGKGVATAQTSPGLQQKLGTDQGSMVHAVPACVVAHFLADIKSHGQCLGPPMPGFRYQATHAAALQHWLTRGTADAATVSAASADSRPHAGAIAAFAARANAASADSRTSAGAIAADAAGANGPSADSRTSDDVTAADAVGANAASTDLRTSAGATAADAAGANGPCAGANTGPRSHVGGIRVTSVPGRECGWSSLKEHDLITAIDGVPVAGDGTTAVYPGLQLSFTHLLASKQMGEEIAVSVVRGARQLEVVCRLGHSSTALLPRNPALSGPSSLPAEQQHLSTSSGTGCGKFNNSAWGATHSAPSVVFPWPAHLLVGHAAMTSLTIPAVEQLYGAKAARRCEVAPWHLPWSASEGGRGRRSFGAAATSLRCMLGEGGKWYMVGDVGVTHRRESFGVASTWWQCVPARAKLLESTPKALREAMTTVAAAHKATERLEDWLMVAGAEGAGRAIHQVCVRMV
ncbi:hypothetical protein DUNSADRAFT_1696 [Dunaliella salina]|uniref:PDZ domain-containing protein n=1 Tax=Dunaliella salina TaxID=3046 RepID=A0ABQ7GWU3_DUNSA|nr:hypothetical protein DUNSADRAFT_1696 [Dunaliella salina]|eukprot:KAF5839079.1 hypothetical protein DUNSADRAFT_1696 [Dunaliella salina]